MVFTYDSTLFLNLTNPAEVFNVISFLKTSKSGGYDISFFLKSAKKVLVFPLAHLFNCSFKLGMFPQCLKIADVLPVYKSGEKFLPVYRSNNTKASSQF